jgi:hypothetical protein
MADDERPRPVSGEIMTDAPETAGSSPAGQQGNDIVDAEYEIVSASPDRKPAPAQATASIGSAAAPLAGMEMLSRRKADPQNAVSRRGGPAFWAFGVGLALAAFWVSGGHALVRSAPFLAAPQQLQALRISGVTSRVDVSGPRPVLFVDGEAANDGSSVETLPALEITVTGDDGRITHYRLGTGDRPLAPGETFAFSSRLDVPKNGVKTVSVTFGE